MFKTFLLASLLAISGATLAKLPTPALTDEAKLKAAEAAAKTAHGNKVANFQLCKSMDAAVASYLKTAKTAGKETKPATATPPCADPGAFVFPVPVAAVAAVAPAATPAAPAAATSAVAAATAAVKPAVMPAAAPVKK